MVIFYIHEFQGPPLAMALPLPLLSPPVNNKCVMWVGTEIQTFWAPKNYNQRFVSYLVQRRPSAKKGNQETTRQINIRGICARNTGAPSAVINVAPRKKHLFVFTITTTGIVKLLEN